MKRAAHSLIILAAVLNFIAFTLTGERIPVYVAFVALLLLLVIPQGDGSSRSTDEQPYETTTEREAREAEELELLTRAEEREAAQQHSHDRNDGRS
ncbi:hypothetical protein [Deinococcus peraridilitoris]|uniref:Uncharacterized protein n=1 Tax=Deinococcus peraridilitoris (strain DSM 19664 / LMG 22246 / CIP 109416 / KR-200) TaxID=937777 RepID=K9ZZQ6_DEIPD|nr:hypothetical protein [Deinococcus peraridilitoris]AFZ67098.1 hypothetical protein Deipe_1557 [Deinococcus peraridilitoris DSM 19664]